MNFKNYKYCNMKNFEKSPCGKIYHNHNLKHAIFTDGRFMILSKELYDESKDVEFLTKKKNVKSKFDFKSFNYMKAVPNKEDLFEINFSLFASEIYLANEKNFFLLI